MTWASEIVIVPTDKPWLLDVWEKLPTKAPSPALSYPYCWGFRDVTFYVRGWLVKPYSFWRGRDGVARIERPARSYQEWDHVNHRLGWDEPIEYNGQTFRCGGGTVTWRGKGRGWWMKYWARREQPRNNGRL